jgi:hypothetical protein
MVSDLTRVQAGTEALVLHALLATEFPKRTKESGSVIWGTFECDTNVAAMYEDIAQ